jgi:uncharacterized protein (TIGR03435 family)
MPLRLAAIPFFLAVALASAQQFEVASLKPSLPGAQGGIIRPLPGNQTYIGTNMPLRVYLTVAYTLRDSQISGGPSWINDDRFDMDAKADHSCTVDELHIMLQNLLLERFHMKVHREKREGPTYSLVIDKERHKLSAHDPQDLNHPPIGGVRSATPGLAGIAGTNVDANYLALFLSRIVDRTVIDKTGLSGYWDFKLEFVPDRPPGAPGDGREAPVAVDGPNIFEAVRQQLSLRLEPSKGPIDHLVIDHIEKLTGN